MKEKLNKIAKSSITYYLVPFTVLGAYLLYLFLNGKIGPSGGYYLIHYLYTYDHGFVARGLVGEIISWFADTVTDNITFGIIFGFSVLLAVISSLCIGKTLNRVKNDKEKMTWAIVLVVILMISQFSLRGYFTDIKLDKILWVLTLLAVYISDTKVGLLLAPVLCLLATLVNPVFLFCSMILISIILLQKFYESGYSKFNATICAVAYISMIALGIYGMVSEGRLGFDTPEEMVNYYFARYSLGLQGEMEAFENEWLFDYFEPFSVTVQKAFNIYFEEWANKKTVLWNTLFAAIPAYSLLGFFWVNVLKREENRFQKFIFFLCFISPVVLLPGIVLSWESSKYFGNNIIVELCLILYYLSNGNKAVSDSLNMISEWFKKKILLGSFITVYLFILMV